MAFSEYMNFVYLPNKEKGSEKLPKKIVCIWKHIMEYSTQGINVGPGKFVKKKKT